MRFFFFQQKNRRGFVFFSSLSSLQCETKIFFFFLGQRLPEIFTVFLEKKKTIHNIYIYIRRHRQCNSVIVTTTLFARFSVCVCVCTVSGVYLYIHIIRIVSDFFFFHSFSFYGKKNGIQYTYQYIIHTAQCVLKFRNNNDEKNKNKYLSAYSGKGLPKIGKRLNTAAAAAAAVAWKGPPPVERKKISLFSLKSYSS